MSRSKWRAHVRANEWAGLIAGAGLGLVAGIVIAALIGALAP